jgi:SAM-dependent methyltransferase
MMRFDPIKVEVFVRVHGASRNGKSGTHLSSWQTNPTCTLSKGRRLSTFQTTLLGKKLAIGRQPPLQSRVFVAANKKGKSETLPMSSPPGCDIKQHNQEIQENLRYWERKPALRREYKRFYEQIAQVLSSAPAGPILECGSGIGNLKSVIPSAITSDLFPNPWLDRTENIFALSFPAEALSGVVLFDVFHHLSYPGTALQEIRRVLRPGGKLVIFEPAAGILGRVVLGLFHHEPLALRRPIRWLAPKGFDPSATEYYAAQGNAWRVFSPGSKAFPLPGWQITARRYYPALPWLLTGGFRGPALCPERLRCVAGFFDLLLSLAPRLFASRMMIVLTATSDPAC